MGEGSSKYPILSKKFPKLNRLNEIFKAYNTDYQKVLDEFLTEQEKTNVENKDFKIEIEKLRRYNSLLQHTKSNDQNNISKLETQVKSLQEHQEILNQEIDKHKREAQILSSEKESVLSRFAQGPIRDTYWSSDKDKKLLSLQEQCKSHEQTITTLLKAKHEIEEENSKLKTKLEQSERNFLKKSKEADNLIGEKQTLEENLNKQISQETRFSKMTRSQSTDGNPNKTNLGDPNRLMKIGESYSELYDNEWVDVMDFCIQKFSKSFGEDIIIQHLLKTIVCCHKLCEEKSSVMLKAGKESLQTAVTALMIVNSEAEVVKQAMDIRKLAAESTSDQLLDSIRKSKKEIITTYFNTVDKKILEMIMSTSFFTKCFKLCWKMVVQDPPMFLDEGPQKDKAFDKNVFREYKSSGNKVAFTVWPALYLHKNGALLVKGVVKVK